MKQIVQLYRDNLDRAKQPVNLVRNASEASLYVYDVIDSYWGVSALSVIDAVAQAGDAEVLHVYINSPGGDVFEGRAIMAALNRFNGKTVAHIDSLCASAATSIALACDEVEMSAGAFFMIHNASGMTRQTCAKPPTCWKKSKAQSSTTTPPRPARTLPKLSQ